MICTQLALIEYCLDCLQFNILLFYAEVCLLKSALIIVEIAMPYVLLCGSECSTFFWSYWRNKRSVFLLSTGHHLCLRLPVHQRKKKMVYQKSNLISFVKA